MAQTQQKSKKSKRPDKRPARARYWASGRMRRRKVRNLVKHNGFANEIAALAFWRSARKRNV